MNQTPIDRSLPSGWKYASPSTPGFHSVISPENSLCKTTWIFRLNLPRGQSYSLGDPDLELSAVVIQGALSLARGEITERIEKLDSFYLPGNTTADLTAAEDASLFVGGGPYEGVGAFFTRKFDLSLPVGDIHQIHGKPPYRREIFMTLDPERSASRLITGLTIGDPGAWTSWPPHQHTADLEEVYCYFDIPAPQFALHLSSRSPGKVEAVHPVSSGDCVAIPDGYHPTVGMPGIKSSYFWVMAAHCRESRRYDLAVNDPHFEC